MRGPDDPTDFQYAGAWGYETEAQNGLDLQYLYQRYYDPDTGRFISRDPIRWSGGLNLYNYVGNDPINNSDPTGLWPKPNARGQALGRNLTAAAAWVLNAPGAFGTWAWKAASPLWQVKMAPGTSRLGDANPESPSGFALRRDAHKIRDGVDEIFGGIIATAVIAGIVDAAAAGRSPCTNSGLKPAGNGVWRSPEGLEYGPGSRQGHRLGHVMEHLLPNPAKPIHSVFDVADGKGLISLVDEAWRKRGAPVQGAPGVFIVPMGRAVGTLGETNIVIVVNPGTKWVVTAYPQF